jgi:predicted lipid carrier protein YhbT
LAAGTSLALRATDPDLATNAWTVHGGAGGVRWTDQPADADVGLSGAAVDLLLAMVRRRSVDDVGIQVEGDADLWRSWLELTPL